MSDEMAMEQDAEQIANDWLHGYTRERLGEHPNDAAYEADEMIDAFMAGRASRPAPVSIDPSGWRSIDSAPRDGTDILAWCVHPNAQYAGITADKSDWQAPVVTRWIDHNGGGWTWHGLCGQFTHWQPLPAPPGAPPLSRDTGEIEAATKAMRYILPYLEWTIGAESPGHHPTMPSAVEAFKDTLASLRGARS
jgi:hypothetical protein